MSIVTARQALSRAPVRRLSSRLPWLDFMLGGGFVRGSVIMVHGEPGSGKSTMLAQAASVVPGSLYVSLEEDISAVAARMARLGLPMDTRLTEGLVWDAAPLVIVDSMQMLNPVGVTKEAVAHARETGACVVLVCHELKGGRFAGPGMIEHLVDCSIRMRRDPRSIACEKNRYGVANIALLLGMTEKGLYAI